MAVFLICLARSANCSELMVSLKLEVDGVIQVIMAVLELPPRESLRSYVSFELR